MQELKTDSHWENCPAPICNEEKAYRNMPNWKSEVVWYAGEPICKRGRTPWNKKQEYVNRVLEKGELQKERLDRPLNVNDLMEL